MKTHTDTAEAKSLGTFLIEDVYTQQALGQYLPIPGGPKIDPVICLIASLKGASTWADDIWSVIPMEVWDHGDGFIAVETHLSGIDNWLAMSQIKEDYGFGPSAQVWPFYMSGVDSADELPFNCLFRPDPDLFNNDDLSYEIMGWWWLDNKTEGSRVYAAWSCDDPGWPKNGIARVLAHQPRDPAMGRYRFRPLDVVNRVVGEPVKLGGSIAQSRRNRSDVGAAERG